MLRATSHVWLFLSLFLAFPQQFLAVDEENAGGSSPLQKVVELMTSLQGKVISDGQRSAANYKSYVSWCKDNAFNKKAEISQGVNLKDKLMAKIAKSKSDAEDCTSQIQELSGSITTDEADLKAVTLLRQKEKQDFDSMDKELSSAIETLARARRILVLQTQKVNGSTAKSFLERPTHGMQVFVESLKELVVAAKAIDSEDRAMLTTLIQAQEGTNGTVQAASGDEDSDSERDESDYTAVFQHPKATGTVLDALDDLRDKLEDSLTETRSRESTARHNYEKLKQHLQNKVRVQTAELNEAKKTLSFANEVVSQSEKELRNCKTSLKDSKSGLETVQHACLKRASEYSQEVEERKREMAALAAAKKQIQNLLASFTQTAATSFVQVRAHTRATSRETLVGIAVAKQLHKLAKHSSSLELAQLASLVVSIMKRAKAGTMAPKSAFGKVKKLIQDMIEKLEKQVQDDLDQKKFCDREVGKTQQSKSDKTDYIDELSSRVEDAASAVANLQEDLKDLYRDMSALSTTQANADSIRTQEAESYKQTKKDLEEGLRGIQQALKVLRSYYGGGDDDSGGGASASFAQQDSTEESPSEDVGASMAAVVSTKGGGPKEALVQEKDGSSGPSSAASTIIGLLEVVQADLAKLLSEATTAEDQAKEEYKTVTQENKVTKAIKERAAKGKNAEITRLKKKSTDLQSDRASTQEELDAIDDYLERLKPQCSEPAESHAQRVAKRAAEVKNLKQALAALESKDEV